jgi:hypothetical protein
MTVTGEDEQYVVNGVFEPPRTDLIIFAQWPPLRTKRFRPVCASTVEEGIEVLRQDPDFAGLERCTTGTGKPGVMVNGQVWRIFNRQDDADDRVFMEGMCAFVEGISLN